MKPIPSYSFISVLMRYCVYLLDSGLTPVKGCIEACNLREFRYSFHNSLYSRKVVRLVKWRQLARLTGLVPLSRRCPCLKTDSGT